MSICIFAPYPCCGVGVREYKAPAWNRLRCWGIKLELITCHLPSPKLGKIHQNFLKRHSKIVTKVDRLTVFRRTLFTNSIARLSKMIEKVTRILLYIQIYDTKAISIKKNWTVNWGSVGQGTSPISDFFAWRNGKKYVSRKMNFSNCPLFVAYVSLIMFMWIRLKSFFHLPGDVVSQAFVQRRREELRDE